MMCNYDTQWSSTMAHGSCKVLVLFFLITHYWSFLVWFSWILVQVYLSDDLVLQKETVCNLGYTPTVDYRLSLVRQNIWVIHIQSKEYDKWGTVLLGWERCSCPAPGSAAQWTHSSQLSGLLLILSALPAKGRKTQEDELLIFTCCWLGSRFAAYFQATLFILMVINTRIHSIYPL